MLAQRLKLERWFSRRLLIRPLLLNRTHGVVSFSFDDAPRSACNAGRQILENFDSRGTFYLAGGLTAGLEMGKPCHTLQDAQTLVANGHHVGCHTWSHQRCDLMPRVEMRTEIERNSQFLTELGVPTTDRHFSFPLGGYHLSSKHLAAQHFASGRLNFGGMQTTMADLNALRASALYQHLWDHNSLTTLMTQVAKSKAWLVLYTHDVDNDPSRYGCTPAMLQHAVVQAQRAGCKVLPVNQAIRYWTDG